MATAPPAPPPFDSAGRGADLVIITSDGTALYVVKAFLIYASQFFANLLGDSLPDETHESLPVYRSAEDCRTMSAVLRLCYPIYITPSEIIVDIPVAEALDKYMMEDAKKRWRNSATFKALVKTEPLRMYAIACRYRWGNIARAAAKALLSFPLLDWQASDELCNITGSDYHVLLQYYAHCSAVVEKVFPSARQGAVIAIPLRNLAYGMKLSEIVADNSCDSTFLAICCLDDDSPEAPVISVPLWVRRLVENVREGLRSCPGRAFKCDKSSLIACVDGQTYTIPQPAGGEVCQIINAGLQEYINTVNIRLNFEEDRVE